ncbi:MAG: kduD [Holophagaceae bacterium]|nr:kduD [Holophagaceae bacterium]
MRTKKTDADLKNLFDISGKVALVTGACGGLGAAVCRGLALNGADLVLCDMNKANLDELAEELRKLGRKVLPMACDITSEESVDAMVAEAMKEMGKIDVLFNGAGVAHRELLVTMDIAAWQRVMDINVKGTLICCKSVAKAMIPLNKPCSIINIGSVRGFNGHEGGYTGYGTSKAAVHYMTKTLAFEWGKQNIRVNSIAPCVFWSPLTEPILSDPKSAAGYLARIPMGAAPEPEDFVGPTIFLASDASAFVTGHILSVDGGTVAG